MEGWVRNGTPFRRVSEMLQQDGITISYGGILRHMRRHAYVGQRAPNSEIGDFIECTREFRHVAITVNVDKEIRKALVRRQRRFQNRLKEEGYRIRATMSSVANYFLRKGAEAIVASNGIADRVLRDFMKRRASFINRRKKRLQGRPATIMISSALHRKLLIDVVTAVWFHMPHEELRMVWNENLGADGEETSIPLPDPSFTDYVNLALKAGLDAGEGLER
jgi:hypothetical protein